MCCIIMGKRILTEDFNVSIDELKKHISVERLRKHPNFYKNFIDYDSFIINSVRIYLTDKFNDYEINLFFRGKYTDTEINNYKTIYDV